MIQEQPSAIAASSLDGLEEGSRANETIITDEDESTKKSQPRNNSPDDLSHLVRKEIADVNFIRALVLILLAIACAASAAGTYVVAKRLTDDVFLREYAVMASSLTYNFLEETNKKLQAAQVTSITISAQVDGGPGSNVTLPYFAERSKTARAFNTLNSMVWSPLLYSEEERREFEVFAIKSSLIPQDDDGTIVCDVCGEGRQMEFPKNDVTIPGYGTFPCETVYLYGKSGQVTATECSFGWMHVVRDCGCIDDENYKSDISNTGPRPRRIDEGIFKIEDGVPLDDDGPGPYSPVWQMTSIGAHDSLILYNLYSDDKQRRALDAMLDSQIPVASEAYTQAENPMTSLTNGGTSTPNTMYASIFMPVWDSILGTKVIGSLSVSAELREWFNSRFPADSVSMRLVFENQCGQAFTYSIEDEDTLRYEGEGNLHNEKYDDLVRMTEFEDFTSVQHLVARLTSRIELNATDADDAAPPAGCAYRLLVYPSEELEQSYDSNTPVILAVCVVFIFALTTALFFLYDFFVARLQRKVMENAAQASSLVASLFPAGVRDRLLQTVGGKAGNEKRPHGGFLPRLVQHPKMQIQSLLEAGRLAHHTGSEPIADLFLNTTVLFADIQGFTAWSSEREPAQVFKLLESVYQKFDEIADRLGVFKVETIGDCYVAVSGLPEPRKNHAVVMAKFAAECIREMAKLTTMLEASLGPSTSDLGMRFGLHSGPVIAGVLRGQKARFQLFGDTMNTAARIESNGAPNCIHASRDTADLLVVAGKKSWLTKREDRVVAKGKGQLETYWVIPVVRTASMTKIPMLDNGLSKRSMSSKPVTCLVAPCDGEQLDLTQKYEQLVDWNTDLLLHHLQKVVARRQAAEPKKRFSPAKESPRSELDGQKCFMDKDYVVDEVTEIMTLPKFDEKVHLDSATTDLGPEVRCQLRSYVSRIAATYREVPFHNFEHASHVALSANKLIQRIIVPEGVNYNHEHSKNMKGAKQAAKRVEREIHYSTFGISSDPLIQFVIVFATVIHDADHTGVANKQLVRRQTDLALKFKGKCVAEQHSVVLSWQILMEDEFQDLRACIYGSSPEEGARFRQLLVNAVMATDIADKELQALRKNRWTKAFQDDHKDEPSNDNVFLSSETDDAVDRKATIVFEHIIQASDVAHTMQHWQVFERWNARLFDEMYAAFITGRSDEDPSIGWYEGEIGFFDFYIIPLAKKLEECGVFGVSSDEYLLYALANRREWELKGRAIVQEHVARQKKKYAGKAISSSARHVH